MTTYVFKQIGGPYWKLEWERKVFRVDQRWLRKKDWNEPEGRRKVEDPDWEDLDDVEDDLRDMKVEKWK